MPSLGSHMARARAVADRLRFAEIDADRGSYYFGATAPDIRVITRMNREVTHFYQLDEYGRQDSVRRMFAENPGLAQPSGLDAATTAFIAGYITHLVLDERYIEDVYRPQFGHFSSIAADPRRDVLDRALQYELDREDREDRDAMLRVRDALVACAPPQDIPFIADEHLVQWRTVAADVAAQEPDYSRFRRMMVRHLSAAGMTEEEVEQYCDAPQELVHRAFEHVTAERIARFWSDADADMIERLKAYLR